MKLSYDIKKDWYHFVLRHRCPTNFFYHLISVILFWGGPILFVFTQNWYCWILFFVSGIVGSIGHMIGTDPGVNLREATSSPAAALMATYMVVRVILGKYQKDIIKAEAYYADFSEKGLEIRRN